ncbi:MAG TPA: 3-oxoacyl-ACP reductase FabG [Gammaproteobacteria bacterium]|nr:3-oxoacyl-ACP reductase FabG [Gammaproteobacteria bacterium]
MNVTQLSRWPGIDGRVALVTGASRGIGQAIASALGAQGAIVIGTATSDANAARISDDLRGRDIAGRGAVLDVRDSASVDALLADVTGNEGAPTMLINNAGITRDNLLLRMKDDEWDDVIETNLGSVYRLSKACLRGMLKARWGRIVSIASVVGLTGNPGQGNYAAAKAGIMGFSKSLAREVASRNITVNAIAPGFIETDMTRSLGEEQVEALRAGIPSGRLGTPADIAAAAVFLCGDSGSYITGETININGGMHMA